MIRLFPFLAISALLLSGCSSTVGVGSDSFASVEVRNSSLPRVRSATIEVFQYHGFQLTTQTERSLSFRKWGDSKTELMYGSFNSAGVQIQAEIIITSIAAESFRVHCDVTMHENKGGGTVDRNWDLKLMGKHAYKGMLREIKAKAER